MIKLLISLLGVCIGLALNGCANNKSFDTSPKLWQADLGNGYYQNPILYADYSDPDVVAVDDDYYMTASSFNAAPGLPILHSKDLVNWQLINYALPQIVPVDVFNVPQHGNGVWAPNIRYHNNLFWIFYPDPDFGIYVVTATDPAKKWSKPKLILSGKGLIDPTPLWDDDGKAYLLHGWAKSRSGINNILTLHEMKPDASYVNPKGTVIIDGHKIPGYKTLEGPKFYKRKGYYYVFAPAGGVPTGWQSVFRAKNINGPYEHKTVMEQGDSLTNGPHQGAWVHTKYGEDWFVHFQSRGAYGRIVHLQPMKWLNDWPVIGKDENGDGIGNPVSVYKKPKSAAQQPTTLPFGDSFDEKALALQWQWNANFKQQWFSLSQNPGNLRLFAQPEIKPDTHNMWLNPAIVLQKLSAPEFIVQTTMTIPTSADNLTAGLILFGENYRWVGIKKIEGELILGHAVCNGARKGCSETFHPYKTLETNTVTLRFVVNAGGLSASGYVDEQGRFHTFSELFQAVPGRWVGAKTGLFVRIEGNKSKPNDNNYADFSEFNFVPPTRY